MQGGGVAHCREIAKALKASPAAASGLAALLRGESREDRREREEVQVCAEPRSVSPAQRFNSP
jgi:translation elongation factor EF-Tu-like GTPase